MDGGRGLGISVNGGSVSHGYRLGRGIRLHIDGSLGVHKALSDLVAFFVQERIANGDIRLVIVLHKSNRHRANQLTLVLVGRTGGTHGRSLGAGSIGSDLTEGGSYFCLAFTHGEDVPTVGIRRHFFLLGDGLSIGAGFGFLHNQLLQLESGIGIDFHQNLLILFRPRGFDIDGTRGYTFNLRHGV